MSKNKVSDLITDQEIAFAHLVFSGTMNAKTPQKDRILSNFIKQDDFSSSTAGG
jgi:hypothetical protein